MGAADAFCFCEGKRWRGQRLATLKKRGITGPRRGGPLSKRVRELPRELLERVSYLGFGCELLFNFEWLALLQLALHRSDELEP